MTLNTLCIIGAGAWGTALAVVAQAAGRNVTLWAHEPETAEAINGAHENIPFLPGVKLNPAIKATTDLGGVASADAVLIVTPAQHSRAVLARAARDIAPGAIAAMCSKGLEVGTGKFMSDILAETVPQATPAVLSGPSFAADVSRGLPTAVTLAGQSLEAVKPLAEALRGANFRPYVADDLVGAQIGGAVKNVLAIAAGIVQGRKLGASAHAATITRGFAELARLGRALGAKPETLRGLSGLGDMILTCGSPQSRNMSLGLALGEGKTLNEILGARSSVTEGVYTAGVVVELARKYDIEMPICETVYDITANGADIDDAIAALLNRPIAAESD